MEISLIIALVVIWAIVGIWGGIYYWIKDFDFTTAEFLLAPIWAVLGPISWGMGWLLARPCSPPKIWIKRK